MKRDLLPEDQITAGMGNLPGWTISQGALCREFTFATYMKGIEFVHQAAVVAEEANHHPDLHVGWRKVGVSLTTHSEGGITELDFSMAAKLDSLNDLQDQ